MFTISDPSHYQQGERAPCLYWPGRYYLYKATPFLIMSSIGMSRRKTSHSLAGMERRRKKWGGVGGWGAGQGLWLAWWSQNWTEPSQREANWPAKELLCVPLSAFETTIKDIFLSFISAFPHQSSQVTGKHHPSRLRFVTQVAHSPVSGTLILTREMSPPSALFYVWEHSDAWSFLEAGEMPVLVVEILLFLFVDDWHGPKALLIQSGSLAFKTLANPLMFNASSENWSIKHEGICLLSCLPAIHSLSTSNVSRWSLLTYQKSKRDPWPVLFVCLLLLIS